MIKFEITEDCPELHNSPMFRAAQKTLAYVAEHGEIGLTATKAFKRTFVHWAAEAFDWPGMGHDELFAMNKVLNEYEFPPLEMLHYLLLETKLGRRYKNTFRLSTKGKERRSDPAALFMEVIPFYLFRIDHGAFSRFDETPIGNWDIWLNVINVEADGGVREGDLFAAFYGPSQNVDNWREQMMFAASVLDPLVWSGLLIEVRPPKGKREDSEYFKTPLWRKALTLDTDSTLRPRSEH